MTNNYTVAIDEYGRRRKASEIRSNEPDYTFLCIYCGENITPQRDRNKIIYFVHSKSTKCTLGQALLKYSYIELWYFLMSKINNKLSGINGPGLIVCIENTEVDLIYDTDRMVTHSKYGGNDYSFIFIKNEIYKYALELNFFDSSSTKNNASVRVDDTLTLVILNINRNI